MPYQCLVRFDIADLRLFLAVIEAGSITHGASDANLSLAAASERLRDMETHGGVQLLVRGPRGTVPTEAGEALAHHARLILRQVADLQDELSERAQGIRATIRLLANTAAMTEFLPERLGSWLAGHPHTDIDLKERQSSDIVKAVSAGLAELGIISSAVDPVGLHLRNFAVDRLFVVVPRDHALAGARRIPLADIAGERFIGLARGALQDHLDDHAARMGRRLTYRARLRTFEGICNMVGQGAGIGIVPERAARRWRRSMPVAAVRLADAWATRHLSICYLCEDDLSDPARDLLLHLAGGQHSGRVPASRARFT